jgi:phosphatidylserine/phosphatidylglycerophosphate/cardiolipin synthase-like enzyme
MLALLAGSVGRALPAQVRAPWDGGTTASLGQPNFWKWTVGAATGAVNQTGGHQEKAQLRFGVFRDIGNPVVGALGWHAEVAGGARGSDFDGGIRARLLLPIVRFGIGANYNALDGTTGLVLSTFQPIRRGGLFGEGTQIRADYLPGRDHSITLGLETPILRRIPNGRARPGRDHVRLPGAAAARESTPPNREALVEALAPARSAADRIRLLAVPFVGRSEQPLALHAVRHPGAFRTIDTEATEFHRLLDRAFSIALAGPPFREREPTPAGERAAGQAREILLDEVLLPYNRLLGQAKAPDGIRGLGSSAQGIFMRRIHMEGAASGEAAAAALWVFTSLLDIVESNRAAIARDWGDSRFVWLPLQYALRPSDHDTQAELDAIVARAVEAPFSEGNFVSYVINEQFQYQLSRTIRAAEDYHVLWTHDFRGNDDQGDPDEMAYRHVVRSYLAALTERVRAYDRTGKFPVYMILLDEWFYQVRNGRWWMTLLEDPTRHRVKFAREFSAWEDTIATAQARLREAIASSSLLESQRRQYGEAWLRNLVKVHVSITNPADPSFWSWRVARGVPLGDNMMRDHRKIVFYDVTETDPYRGEAIYTGAGVGENYSNKSWEDRSLLVRGPAILSLKDAARELLVSQGIPPERVPWPLQQRAKPRDYDERVRGAMARSDWPVRALGVHNGTGFASKQVNVAKAVLYTLMPAGSVVKVPDSLWNNDFWGSALFGCALRGVRVLIIAPSDANHPVEIFGSRALSRELFSRLLAARREFAPEIAAAGGQLRIGLYNSPLAVDDIPGKVAAVRRAFGESAWLRELFGFPPSVYDDLGTLSDEIRQLAMAAPAQREFEHETHTKLHLKANFFASREAWSIMTRPEWGAMTWEFVGARIAQVQSRTAAVERFEEFPDALLDLGGATVRDWFAKLTPAARERAVLYTVMGSQNQNFRSMVTDGETAFVVANWPSVIPYLDLISLVGQSRWIETQAELDALIPPRGPVRVGMAHWFRLVF